MTRDVELLLGWQFHRVGAGVGSRFESTAWLGFDCPTDAVRAGVRTDSWWRHNWRAAGWSWTGMSAALW